MFGHICLGTKNLSESITFYDQVMSTLNIQRQETGETYACYGDKKDVGSGENCLFIGKTFNGNKATAGNGVNIALLAKTRNQVKEFYEKAI
jgi:catechol 2,3-dioxygenase-like lactoylglutathione lyase family enzyme